MRVSSRLWSGRVRGLMLPVLILLLAILSAIPLVGLTLVQTPPGDEITLVNSDREFVERKKEASS